MMGIKRTPRGCPSLSAITAHNNQRRLPAVPEVSVIVPSYRSSRTLYQCLTSLTAQCTTRAHQVIVVHSGDEPIPEHVQRTFAHIEFHTFQERLLPGKARNWAVFRVTSPAILFLDADCVVSHDWIERMMCNAEEALADAIGGSVYNAMPHRLSAWTMHILEFDIWFPGGRRRRCADFPTCNSFYKRDILLESGGFPEDLYPGEDTALNFRLHQLGYRLFFVPEVSVGHIYDRNIIEIIRYNYAHGLAYGQACLEHRLPGRFLLCINKVPAVVVAVTIRWLHTLFRLITKLRPETAIFLFCTPYVIICLLAWALGFTDANRSRGNKDG